MRRIRAAVIGLGRVGTILEEDPLRSKPCTHAGYWAGHTRTELVAGCDISPERRARFAMRWRIPPARIYEDYRDLLKEERPEAVSIATWTDSHAAITIAAARAGVRVILSEKPMARSLREARAMIDACREEGATLVIHHERRWQTDFRGTRKLILEGRIGEVRTILGAALTGAPHPDWHAHPAIAGGGPLLHDGTHLFDAVRYLAGEIAWVSARLERNHTDLHVEDTAVCLAGLRSGATAFLEGGGRRGYFHFGLEFQGSHGKFRIGNEEWRHWEVAPSPRYQGFIEFRETSGLLTHEGTYFPGILDEILAAAEEGRPSISSGEEGYAALEAVLASYESARTGREVMLPLDPDAPGLAGILAGRWR